MGRGQAATFHRVAKESDMTERLYTQTHTLPIVLSTHSMEFSHCSNEIIPQAELWDSSVLLT